MVLFFHLDGCSSGSGPQLGLQLDGSVRLIRRTLVRCPVWLLLLALWVVSSRRVVMGATYSQAKNNYFIGLMLLATVTAFLAFLSAFPRAATVARPNHAK